MALRFIFNLQMSRQDVRDFLRERNHADTYTAESKAIAALKREVGSPISSPAMIEQTQRLQAGLNRLPAKAANLRRI